MRNNDYRSVIAVWSDVAEKSPLNARAHSNLAYALAESGATNEALDHYREAVRLDPTDSKVHSNLGGLLVQMGRVDEAMEQYHIALEIDPNNGAAHTNRGVILSQTGHSDEAMAEFEQALKCDHQDAEAHNNLGVVMAELNRMPEAASNTRTPSNSIPITSTLTPTSGRRWAKWVSLVKRPLNTGRCCASIRKMPGRNTAWGLL